MPISGGRARRRCMHDRQKRRRDTACSPGHFVVRFPALGWGWPYARSTGRHARRWPVRFRRLECDDPRSHPRPPPRRTRRPARAARGAARPRVRRAPPRTARELLPLLYRTDPDVLLVDELELVRRVKTEAPRTRVVLYVAEPSPELLLAAAIAGADGVVDKAAADARAAARACAASRAAGGRRPRVQARAAARLDPRDRPIFAMRLAGTSAARDRGRGRDDRRRAQRARAGDRRPARALRALAAEPARRP